MCVRCMWGVSVWCVWSFMKVSTGVTWSSTSPVFNCLWNRSLSAVSGPGIYQLSVVQVFISCFWTRSLSADQGLLWHTVCVRASWYLNVQLIDSVFAIHTLKTHYPFPLLLTSLCFPWVGRKVIVEWNLRNFSSLCLPLVDTGESVVQQVLDPVEWRNEQ